VNVEQHLAEAEKWLAYAHDDAGKPDRAAAYAAIATAHATIAAAKQKGAQR